MLNLLTFACHLNWHTPESGFRANALGKPKNVFGQCPNDVVVAAS